jgi:hypothetical protein
MNATSLNVKRTPTNSPSALALGAALFDEAATLASGGDSIYADCILARAFGALLEGIAANECPEALVECAGAIEDCAWLTNTVRAHVGRILRAAAAGEIPPSLASQIVAAAAQRTSHQMATEIARSFGADGAAYVSDALGDISAAIEGRTH